MAFNLFASPTIDDIRVGYIDPQLGYVDSVTICEANNYAKDNPGTTFVFVDGNNVIRYLNINEVNDLTVNDLISKDGECGGIQAYKECGPPRIQFFGGDGIGAAANPIIGRDGSLLAIDVVRGGHGYQYPPIVAAKDDCLFGTGAVLTAILGETADETEVFEGEEDFEEYEICEDTDVGYGERYGPNGEVLGAWEPSIYTKIGEDPIRREIDLYQKILEKPFWTSRKTEPISITSNDGEYYDKYVATHPEWGEFMNKYAISPVKPSELTGTDEAAKTFIMEWEENFPITGEYIFRGTCDDAATLYIDDISLGNLDGFKANPRNIQKTIQEGNHKIKIELFNEPKYKTVTTPVTTFVDVNFTVYGQGAFRGLSFSFVAIDGSHSFTIMGASKDKKTRTDVIKVKTNTVYNVKAKEDSSKYKSVEQGIIKNGTKDDEGGTGTSNKIFADYIGSGNDNDDIQITSSIGTFTSSRKVEKNGRSTFNLSFTLSGVAGSTKKEKVISPKSWQQNPMGVSLSIDAPFPPIPQEQPPIQTGKCPPNPIWSTRFPGSSQRWYPVRFTRPNSWSKFMNRYALSPVLPLNTPGSDISGVTFTNSWEVDLPYAGFYGVKGTRDNRGRLLIDGQEVSTLDPFSVNNPKLTKKYLTKGRHTITVEISNTPQETKTSVDTKIFSTQDWGGSLSAPLTATTTTSNLTAKFIQKGSSYYLQVDGTGTGKIFFVMDVNDSQYIAGLAAKEVIIPSDKGSVTLSRTQGLNSVNAKNQTIGQSTLVEGGYPTQETIKDSGSFSGGKLYGPIQILGAGPTARGPIPIKGSSNKLAIRDADGDDENIKVVIEKIENASSTTPPPAFTPGTVTVTKNGVTYKGPELFKHKDTRWSKFMNNFSVSPKVFNSISTPENPVIGNYTLTWENVNFPQDGVYKFNFQGDNIAKFKIDGIKIYETSDFIGSKVQYTFNVSAGKHKIEIVLENVKSFENVGIETIPQDFIFEKNPMGVALFISKDIISSDTNKTPWTDNPVAVSAILIPPPCAKKIGGRGVVEKVIIEDPGNGYISPQGDGYPITLVLDEVIVENPGINYRCGEDQIQIIPDNGAILEYDCNPFGKIKSVKVLNPGVGFNVYPEISIPSETGVNATFRPVFKVVRDPLLPPEKLIQVTDLVGLKQTGYVDGRAYYGAVYYDEGISYAGYYKTAGTQVRVYATLQESITARVTTPASAIQRSGTDIRSNDPRLNIPGTPESTTEQT